MTVLDTSELRSRLEEERNRLANAVDFLHAASTTTLEDELGEIGSGGTDNHLGDTASATYDRGLDHGLEEGAQQTLDEIDDGTYGTCEICGKPIGSDRLRALPWARLCIDDQRRAG